MQELNLIQKKALPPDVVDPNALFQLGMTGVTGSQVLTDLVSGVALTRIVTGSPSIQDGFVDHPTYGHCYRFTGATRFVGSGAIATIPLNTLGSYLIEFEMVTDILTTCALFETGNYPSSSIIRAGSSITMGQFANTFLQFFQTTGGGSFQRNFVNETNPQAMHKYSISRSPNGTVMTDVTSGSTAALTNFNTTGDSYCWIGAANNNGNPEYFYSGYLKSFKISKVLT